MEVKEAIGDMAYVSENNLDVCEGKGVTLFARTNCAVAAAAASSLDEGFSFNKDAGLLQCRAGELAMREEKRSAKNWNTYLLYVFSKRKCQKCPLREKCRIGKSKSYSYSTIANILHGVCGQCEKNREVEYAKVGLIGLVFYPIENLIFIFFFPINSGAYICTKKSSVAKIEDFSAPL